MAKARKTDLEAVVKKVKSEADKTPVSNLKVFTVEPVIKPKDKRNKTKGKAKDDKRKSTKKPGRKTDERTIKKGEEKPPVGEKTPLPIQARRRTFFDWFTDGGRD